MMYPKGKLTLFFYYESSSSSRHVKSEAALNELPFRSRRDFAPLAQELKDIVKRYPAVFFQTYLAGFARGISRATAGSLIDQSPERGGGELRVGETSVSAEAAAGDFLNDFDFAAACAGDGDERIGFACLLLTADGVDEDGFLRFLDTLTLIRLPTAELVCTYR